MGSALMPTPDNPDEFYLLLALVVSLLPLQWYLGRKLHQKVSCDALRRREQHQQVRR